MSQLLIQFTHLFHTFVPCSLFEDISLSIHRGEVFALIGENGAGKTTLLKLLTGELMPDQGSITRTANMTIGFLPQEIYVDSSITAREYLQNRKLAVLKQTMDACLEDRIEKWAELHAQYEELGGYEQIPLEKVVNGLKLKPELLDLPMRYLSSGQRVRIALARALMDNPDLLLLDEPTNHLDADMLRWLTQFLATRKGATVIVSHDRKFMNASCNRVLEIKEGKLTFYGGNYDFYLTEKQRFLEQQLKEYDLWKEDKRLLKQKIQAMTFAKGKAPAPKDRNIMAYDYRGGNHQKSEARKIDILKDRLAELEKYHLQHPKPKSVTGLRFVKTALASECVIELEGMTKAYGDKVLFSNMNCSLCKGDRIALVGPNGTGKTTFIRCVAGLVPLDSGQVKRAPTAKIAYLDQEVGMLPLDKTPLEYFGGHYLLSEETLRKEQHKAGLGMDGELIHRSFGSLSTGQRKRFALLSLVLEKPNVLLLDEPTNHLDLGTLESLEIALLQFEGAILFVSHDGMLREKIATQIWEL